MKFAARHDVNAPAAFAAAVLADFDGWERMATRRGVEVRRTDAPGGTQAAPAPGTVWDTRFAFRGKAREITLRLQAVEPGGSMVFLAETRPAVAEIRVELIGMAAARSRLAVMFEVRPRTLGARLFIQSLRLARSRVDARFAQRVAQLAGEIEARYRAS